ncbi:MAG: PAS domain S-box protein [Planctomycetaceae bacterium]
MVADIAERDRKIMEVTERYELLARAQADAIVRSAEIIDELEITRQNLSDARQAAEKAAEDTKRLADTIFERTNDGVLVFCDYKCIACNDNASVLLGTSRDRLLGNWPRAFETACYENEASAASDIRSMHANAFGNKINSVEVRLPIENEGHFWAEVTMSAFSMGDAGHVLAVVQDITSHKEFEYELRQQRDLLDNIINAVPDQLSVMSDDLSLVVANNAFCENVGEERDDLIGRSAENLIPREMLSGIQKSAKTGIELDHNRDIIHHSNDANGISKVWSIKRSQFGDDSGKNYIVSTARDITEDRVREDRLRLLASVFNGASEGVAILAIDGEICEANPAFIKMIGLNQESLVGGDLEDAIRFDIGEIDPILADVARGNPWSGKAITTGIGRKIRHFWVSISHFL